MTNIPLLLLLLLHPTAGTTTIIIIIIIVVAVVVIVAVQFSSVQSKTVSMRSEKPTLHPVSQKFPERCL